MTSTKDIEMNEDPRSTSVFRWEDVSYGVGKGTKTRQILNNNSGQVTGGELCAIIGPSGAGKTSLLNILAGRIRNKGPLCRVSGNILLDGAEIQGATLRKRIAYVMQEDLLPPTSTPREALLFSALMRLPSNVSMKEKSSLVEKMIEDLGLTKCADTFIGDHMLRGISGGEKKRTSIGIELVMKPKLIFLDEPTSGLDSFAAHAVVKKMRGLAETGGCNVLCTIHQPSSEVFHVFQKVLLLRNGSPLYFGSVGELSKELSRLDRSCPREYNLADHAVYLIQTESDESLDSMQKEMKHIAAAALGSAKGTVGNSTKASAVAATPHVNFLVQLAALTLREYRAWWRNKPGLIASIVIPTCINMLLACIFYQVGDTHRSDYSINSHFGAFTIIAISGMFGSVQPILLRFPLDRGIFLREYATSTYGAVAYFLSKMFVEFPQLLLNALVVMLVNYWMMGFNGSFILYVLVFWFNGLAAASTALLIGCLAANAETASQAGPAVFVPQLLFAGFYIRLNQVPVWLRWMQYLCSLKYGMNLFITIEFGENVRKYFATDEAKIAAKAIIDDNDMEEHLWWFYCIMLVAITTFFRGTATFALARRASAFF